MQVSLSSVMPKLTFAAKNAGLSQTTANASVSFGRQVSLKDAFPTADRFATIFEEKPIPTLELEVLANRRKALLQQLPAGSTVVLVGASKRPYTPQVGLPFHQDSNFYYFTGINEPDAIAVLSTVGGKPTYNLIVQPLTKDGIIWGATNTGVAGAKKYDAKKAYPHTSVPKESEKVIPYDVLGEALAATAPVNSSHLYLITPYINATLADKVKAALPQADQTGAIPAITRLRMVKSDLELGLLMQASKATAAGFKLATKNLKQKKSSYEFQTAADLEYGFARAGAAHNSFPTIAAAGSEDKYHACGLHYDGRNGAITKDDFVLMDGGGEFGYMAGDVTRVIPVSKFSKEQRDIYALVLKAQKAAIEAVHVGATFQDLDQAVLDVYKEGLIDLGIFNQETATKENIKKLFPHHTGHYLGMDCHDPTVNEKGNLPTYEGEESRGFRDLPFLKGMAITVEPGLYFAPATVEELGIDRKWLGIGIRIEDNIVPVVDGYVNLTQEAGIPKELDEVDPNPFS